MALLAIGLLGSVVFVSQDISAATPIGKDIVITEKITKINPDLDRMQQIVDLLTNEQLTETQKDSLYNEADDIRQKALTAKVVYSEETMRDLKNSHELMNDIGSANGDFANAKFREIIMGHGIQDGKLIVYILPEKFTESYISNIITDVREIVGTKIDIQFEEKDAFTLTGCSQSGDCNPLQGGTKIEAKNHSTCSATFQAKDGSTEGFIMAGHCGDAGSGSTDDVFQPTEDWFGWNKIGDIVDNAYDSDTKCDCAFVDASESISDKIYNNIAAGAVGTVVEDDYLTTQSFDSGTIVGTVETVPFSTYVNGNYHRDHFLTTHDLAGGDSGGVLYESGAQYPDIMGGIVADGNGDSLHWQAEYLDDEISGVSFDFS